MCTESWESPGGRRLTPGGLRGGVARLRAGRVEPGGAHLLRHSPASGMLAAGGSLEEIGQVLRHERRDRTSIYAKVDRRSLVVVTRPGPETKEGGRNAKYGACTAMRCAAIVEEGLARGVFHSNAPANVIAFGIIGNGELEPPVVKARSQVERPGSLRGFTPIWCYPS